MEVGPSSPINDFGMMDNADRSLSSMTLPNLGPVGLKTLQLQEQQGFHSDFIDYQEHVYREQNSTSDSHEHSDADMKEE